MAAPEQPPARVERILDAAAELLVRWGYQRVTIDEVARHAHIGKGTVYLHFKTKDALFLTVLLRTHRRVVGNLVDRMESDPEAVLPSVSSREVYLAVANDPVARPLYLGDPEVLGRLVQEAGGTMTVMVQKRSGALRHALEVLRAAGLLRADLDVDELLHVFAAVTTGFFVIDGAPAAVDVEKRADLLATTVRAAIEVPGRVPPDVAREVAGIYRSLITHIDDEWKRRVR
ncbi:TetR/AcrR family transcriptional regulator [Pseudonocardia sp. TRM90224]|uniref:TetR/AcrR family transcriptional regulator n=1 Tax=Pseudonocardia sp. TRM90224 TaxID=2812678 RepID=UPI001E4C29F0|nr:TetR/AcrR family transcriptional regulator [Pseudonocardia sp. TRM90224]